MARLTSGESLKSQRSLRTAAEVAEKESQVLRGADPLFAGNNQRFLKLGRTTA